jgi:HEAT repeat protein
MVNRVTFLRARRRGHALWVAFTFLVVFCGGGAGIVSAAPPFSVEKAIDALANSSATRPYWNADERLRATVAECHMELLYISALPNAVEERLVDLTGASHPDVVRCRALVTLMMRNSDRGLQIAARQIRSRDTIQRLMAWISLEWYSGDVVRSEKWLPAKRVVELFSDEPDKDVRKGMIAWFGRRKLREAVVVLCHTAGDQHRSSSEDAVDALGRIGDPRSVDAIIHAPSLLPYRLLAIARIGGREGVDFLIENLDQPMAPFALAETGDPRGIAPLRASLARLEQREMEMERSGQRHLRQRERDALILRVIDARVALMKLESKDPNDALMKLAEDRKQVQFARDAAMAYLQGPRAAPPPARVLALYQAEQGSAMGTECIEILAPMPGEEITKAMISHLAKLERKERKWARDDATPNADAIFKVESVRNRLIDVLHRRIGNKLFELPFWSENEKDVK